MPYVRPATVPRRLFSSDLPESKITNQNASETLEKVEEEEEEKPWFLEVEPPRHAPAQHKEDLPQAPEDAPAVLGPLIQYVHEDMGLDELSLLDLRDLDPPASLGPNLIMLFATARSERHLHISSARCVRWLKRNHKVGAKADGLIGPGELKTKLRRLRKKAKLMGTNTAMIPGGDNGISTGWVCVNFTTDSNGEAESAHFDEDGRISGFGSAQSGTTVVLQCLTEGRREELDLETLWKGIFRRNLEEQSKIKGEKSVDKAKIEGIVSSKLQLHRSPGQSQWDAMKQASIQHRLYSTSARAQNSFEAVRREMADIQFGGAAMDQTRLETVTSNILHASGSDVTSSERLALLDEILQTGEERGLEIRSRDMLVHLIESMVTSPAYGAELGRAQKNLEFLLTADASPPTDKQVMRLMSAYASRKDWEKVWDAFRTPTRFNMPRSAALYELAYRILAGSQDKMLTRETLRWMFPEMTTENPPVLPTGGVHHWLKASILVADPAAEETLLNPPPTDDLNAVEKRRLLGGEMVKMLRAVEAMRDGLQHGHYVH